MKGWTILVAVLATATACRSVPPAVPLALDDPRPAALLAAWRPLEADVLDPVSRGRDVDRDAIAAQRVVANGGVGVFLDPEIPRPPAVIQDHLLVQFAKFAHAPNTSIAWTIPSAKRSRSSLVLYIAIDARTVATTPKRCISGWAQWWPARTATPLRSSTVPDTKYCVDKCRKGNREP